MYSTEYSDRIIHLVTTKKLDKPKYRDRLYQLLADAGHQPAVLDTLYAALLQINQSCIGHPFATFSHEVAIGSHIVSKSQFKQSHLWHSRCAQTSYYDPLSRVSAKSQGYCLFCKRCDQLFGYSKDPAIPAIDTPSHALLKSDRFALLTAYRLYALLAKQDAVLRVLQHGELLPTLDSPLLQSIRKALQSNGSLHRYQFKKRIPPNTAPPFIGIAPLSRVTLQWASAHVVEEEGHRVWIVQWHGLQGEPPSKDWVLKMLSSPVVYRNPKL